jgi:hypothetical protein
MLSLPHLRTLARAASDGDDAAAGTLLQYAAGDLPGLLWTILDARGVDAADAVGIIERAERKLADCARPADAVDLLVRTIVETRRASKPRVRWFRVQTLEGPRYAHADAVRGIVAAHGIARLSFERGTDRPWVSLLSWFLAWEGPRHTYRIKLHRDPAARDGRTAYPDDAEIADLPVAWSADDARAAARAEEDRIAAQIAAEERTAA